MLARQNHQRHQEPQMLLRFQNSSRASSRGSCTASVTIARAKEAARVAELEAKIAMLEKCQAPKEKKFRVKQEETHQKLGAEIAKTSA